MFCIDVLLLFCIGNTVGQFVLPTYLKSSDQQSNEEVVDRAGKQRGHDDVNRRDYIINKTAEVR